MKRRDECWLHLKASLARAIDDVSISNSVVSTLVCSGPFAFNRAACSARVLPPSSASSLRFLPGEASVRSDSVYLTLQSYCSSLVLAKVSYETIHTRPRRPFDPSDNYSS